MPSVEPVSLRCIGLGLGVLLLSIGLRLLLGSTWMDNWRLPALMQSVYAERCAVLLGLDVAGLALLTAGVLGAHDAMAVAVCAFWATVGVLLECSQHPSIARRLLAALADRPADSLLANGISLYLLNARFSIGEIIGAIAGGCAGFSWIHRSRRTLPLQTRM
jgi:membrane protein DedA with SNARE-associated domain